MLDKVILRLKEEVAMDGYQGTSINDMWNYIQRFLSEESNKSNNNDNDTKPIEPTMDFQYKQFFWRYFQHIPELSFFLGNEDTDAETVGDSSDDAPNDIPDSSANEEEEMGTEVEHDLIVGVTELQYDQVESQYGSRLRVVADKKLQEAQMFVGIPIGQTWSVYLRKYLTSVLQAREAGITQYELTKNGKPILGLLGILQKHWKPKVQCNQRIMVTYKGTRTNLCIHTRFKNRDQAHGTSDSSKPHNANMLGVIFTKQVFRDRLLALLTDAKDNMMFSFDILTAMGFDLNASKTRHWFNRALDRLSHEGFIRKLTAQRNNAGQRHRCIQLLKDNFKNAPTNITFGDLDPFVMTSRNGLANTSKLLHHMPLDKQVLQAIQDAGDQGIINKDIAIAIRCDNSRMTGKALERLGEIQGDERFKYGLERALEFEGRNRRYRFYAYANYVKMNESEPVDIPVIDPFDIKESGLKEVNYQTLKSGKSRKTATDSGAEPTKRRGRPAKNAQKPTSKRQPNSKTSSSNSDSNITTSQSNSDSILPSQNPDTDTVVADSSVDNTTHQSSSPATDPSTEPTKRRGRPSKNSQKPTSKNQLDSKTNGSNSDCNITASQSSSDPILPSQNPDTDTVDNTAHQSSSPVNLSASVSGGHLSDGTRPSSSGAPQLDEPTTPPPNDSASADKTFMGATDPAQSSSKKRLQPDKTENNPRKKRPTRSVNTITGYFNVVKQKETKITDSNTTATESSSQSALPVPTESTISSLTSMETTIAAPSSVSREMEVTTASTEPSEPTSTDSLGTNSAETIPSTTIKSTASTTKPPTKPSTQQSNTAKPKFAHRNKPVQINKYLEERKQVILALLEDNAVIERGVILKNRFEDKRAELFGDTGNSSHMIDMKTLWRSAEALKKEGLLHIRDGHILLFNGNKSKKQVLVHKSLDPDGPEVDNYFEYLNERKILQPSAIKLDPIEKANVAVESLEDRLHRMQQSRDQAMAAGKLMEAKRLDTEIQLITGNKMVSSETFDLDKPKKIGDWLLTGMKFGYVNSFMVRAKMLHQYLLGIILSNSGADEDVDLEKRLVPTTVFVHRMPLSLFCTIIGVFTPTNQFYEYMEDEAHGAVTLENLPDNIRGCLFYQKNRSIYRLRMLIRTLLHLGVIESADSRTTNENSENISTIEKPSEHITTYTEYGKPIVRPPPQLKLAYKLATKTTIRNYRLPGHPETQEHSLLDQAEIMMYWSELQYLCTKSNLGDDESATPHAVDQEDEECIRTLYAVKNWGHSMIFTRKQKQVMNDHVDKDSGSTPYDSPVWCKSIALEVGATVDGVRRYYRKLEESMGRLARTKHLKKKDNMEDKTPPQTPRRQAEIVQRRQRRRRIDDGIVSGNTRVITKATTSPFKYKRTSIPRAELLAMKQREQQLQVDGHGQPVASGKFLDDNATIPCLTQDDISSKLIKTRSKRMVWTMEEDDLLKLAYVIMNHRRESGCRFLWKPIDHILSRFTNVQCRKRLSMIRDNLKHAEDLQNIRIRWHRYYSQGVHDGDLAVWKKVNDNNFDITSYLAYYLRRCQLDQEQDIPGYHIHLPANTQLIDQHFDINPIIALNQQSDDFFEDTFHQKNTSIAMRQALCLQGFTQRINSKESYDYIPTQNTSDLDTNKRIVELLKHFFKMILLTPAEVYDPFFANSVMSSFPEDMLKTAIAESRSAGVLIHAKGDRIGDRRLPKTLLGVSERFMRSMTVHLPENILTQANEYEKYLIQTTHTSLDPVELNSGMMLCIFDLFSAGKLSIDMDDLGRFIKKFNIPSHASRNINENKQNYDISVTLLGRRVIPGPAKRIEQQIMTLTENQLESTLKQLHELLNNEMSTLIQRIVTYLHSQRGAGATVLELKQALLDDENIGDVSDDLLMSVVDAVTLKACPPLAVFVGYGTPRLVLTTELPTWAILSKAIPSNYLSSAYKRRKTLKPASSLSSQVDQRAVVESTESAEPTSDEASTTNTPCTTQMPMTVPSPADDDNASLVDVKSEIIAERTQPTSAIAASEESSAWATKRNRPHDVANVDGDRQVELAQQRQDVIMPRMWIDINGHVTDSIWRGCIELLVETIMRRPGVTYGHLCRTMNATLSPIEIKDLLNDLLGLGVLRQLAVSTGKATPSLLPSLKPKLGLFKSNHTAHTVPVNTIDPAIQTSYWLLPGYYSKLS
ncbi:hypothetical protein BCR42DRAFT_400485 [Absidia repens]|uniref:Myb-like domain-containing protein n=1 Tax=Absidia repens TaxID=90262 RepID=A0A1X2J2X4_9FUNG|nr:hypothetical protein BCR42DRAFT_400485 [Absidia repens]